MLTSGAQIRRKGYPPPDIPDMKRHTKGLPTRVWTGTHSTWSRISRNLIRDIQRNMIERDLW